MTTGESTRPLLQAILGDSSLLENAAPAEELFKRTVTLLFNHSFIKRTPKILWSEQHEYLDKKRPGFRWPGREAFRCIETYAIID